MEQPEGFMDNSKPNHVTDYIKPDIVLNKPLKLGLIDLD